MSSLISDKLFDFYQDFVANGTDGDDKVVSFEEWLTTLESNYDTDIENNYEEKTELRFRKI